jgi:trk system potassium uptake protein TrkH
MLLGGLGLMTLATFMLIVLGQRITLPERIIMRDTLALDRLGGLVRITRNIIVFVLALQAFGTLMMFFKLRFYFSPLEALWQSAFLSVSSFNNAGLNIVPGEKGLGMIAQDYSFLGLMMVLIALGGISWTVLVDIWRNRRFSRLNLDTKLVLATYATLWVVGALVMFVVDFSNKELFADQGTAQKGFLALFHSISARTAGFSTIDLRHASDMTLLLFAGLMFIGGATGSTAGGIRVNTFAVIVAAVWASIRGRAGAEVFGREIPQYQVYRALAVAVLSLLLVFSVSIVLTFTDPGPRYLDVLFETTSAFGTVGLSTGITPLVSDLGAVLLMITMFVGEVGPLTLALAIAPKEVTPIRYVQERVRIG